MTEETQKDPARTLADNIIENLMDAGLVSQAKKAEILAKLTAGTARAEDWGLWTELALEENEAEQEETEE